jgi:hypothetical protein
MSWLSVAEYGTCFLTSFSQDDDFLVVAGYDPKLVSRPDEAADELPSENGKTGVVGPAGDAESSSSSDDWCRGLLQFCEVCKCYKAPRSHHCRKCKDQRPSSPFVLSYDTINVDACSSFYFCFRQTMCNEDGPSLSMDQQLRRASESGALCRLPNKCSRRMYPRLHSAHDMHLSCVERGKSMFRFSLTVFKSYCLLSLQCFKLKTTFRKCKVNINVSSVTRKLLHVSSKRFFLDFLWEFLSSLMNGL